MHSPMPIEGFFPEVIAVLDKNCWNGLDQITQSHAVLCVLQFCKGCGVLKQAGCDTECPRPFNNPVICDDALSFPK